MATTIVTPAPSNNNSGMGFLLGMILLIVMAILFFVYGLPYISHSMTASTPQVNVPSKINVNVQHSKY